MSFLFFMDYSLVVIPFCCILFLFPVVIHVHRENMNNVLTDV